MSAEDNARNRAHRAFDHIAPDGDWDAVKEDRSHDWSDIADVLAQVRQNEWDYQHGFERSYDVWGLQDDFPELPVEAFYYHGAYAE